MNVRATFIAHLAFAFHIFFLSCPRSVDSGHIRGQFPQTEVTYSSDVILLATNIRDIYRHRAKLEAKGMKSYY